MGLASIAGGLAAIGWGWKQRASGKGLLFLVLAIVVSILWIPAGFTDHVTVIPERLQTRWGFSWFPTKHDIAFADVSSVCLTKKTTWSGRRPKTTCDPEFCRKEGAMESLTVSNALMKAMMEPVVLRPAEHGAVVTDLTGD